MLYKTHRINKGVTIETITFRKAKNNDYLNIEEIFTSILKEYNLPFIEGESNEDIQNLECQYSKNSVFYVAINNENNIIGMIGLLEINNHESKLTKFYISKKYRGKNIGIQLLNKIIEFANNHNIKFIILETNSKLKSAIHLFEKYGFIKSKKEDLPQACDSFYTLKLDS